MALTLAPLLRQWLESQVVTRLNPMLLFFLLIVSFFFLFFLLKLNGSWLHKSSINLPPSPPKLPVIGNLHQLHTLAHRSLRDLSQKYGPLMLLQLGCAKVLVVSSTEMAKEIMKNQDTNFANRPVTTAVKVFLYGCKDVAFSPYGEYWRQVRKLCVLDLLSIKRVQSFKSIREEEVALLIKRISQSASLGSSVNLSEMLRTLANNFVSSCTFGSKCEEEDGKNRFGELSKEVMQLMGVSSVGDFFPSLGWIDILTGLRGRLKRAFHEINAFFDLVIDERLARKEKELEKQLLLDLLLLAQRDHTLDVKLNRDNIKAIMMDMFVAGTDTSATTTEWAIAELIKNPNIMKKAQEEVRRVVGRKMKVEEEDIRQMDYLKCIIKETLRLHAPVPTLGPRESIASAHVNGYYIPPKTRVFINVWAIQRDSKVWDRAEEFNPERFSCSNVDFKGQDFEFIPFGSGRRSCPGVSFGLSFVELVLANILFWFDWKLPDGGIKEELDMTEAFGLSVNKKIPLQLLPTIHPF